MIRFNGYPFLEKDDHAYNVPGEYICIVLCRHDSHWYSVSRVMKRDLRTLPVSGLTVQNLGKLPRQSMLGSSSYAQRSALPTRTSRDSP